MFNESGLVTLHTQALPLDQDHAELSLSDVPNVASESISDVTIRIKGLHCAPMDRIKLVAARDRWWNVLKSDLVPSAVHVRGTRLWPCQWLG